MNTVILFAVLSLPYVGVYAMLGLGITTIYQASRVLNLAHGAIAMGAAYMTYVTSTKLHLPLVLAVFAGLIFGAVLGLLVERLFVSRLRLAGPTTQTVGTVAVLTLGIAVAARVFGSLPVTPAKVLPATPVTIAQGQVHLDLLLIFPIGVAGALALFALLQFTDVGLAMRGAAQNRRGAALRGINPDHTAMLAWIIGGTYAGLAGILLTSATTLDPYGVSLVVLPAFIAALIGGLDNMPGVLLGALVVGMVQGMVPALSVVPAIGALNIGLWAQSQGAPVLVLGVLALLVMASRGARLSTGDTKADTL